MVLITGNFEVLGMVIKTEATQLFYKTRRQKL